jgi:S1-C subfamily serine protease
LVIDQLRQASRDARNSFAAIILVLASVISACAAVAGLTSWVTVTAAVAAVLSGGQVLRKELIVPMRIRSAESATLRVRSRSGQQPRFVGTAFQIANNRWITAHHVIAESDEILLKAKGEEASAQILYQNSDIDIAVLLLNSEWAWRARAARSLPEPGDRVKVVGWTRIGSGQSLRIAFEYLVQGQDEDNRIVLTGADHPQPGFSGGPVIDMRSGRVVGILRSVSRDSRDRFPGAPEPVTVISATPISEIPAQYR